MRAEYEGYARNALVQLRRVRKGTHLEEDHMRNRQAIVHWLMAHTSAIERRQRDGRTFYVVVDVEAFREGVGRMLTLVQRIKSEGLYDEAVALFEAHGIHFDPALRDEVVARVDRLDLPSYTGFVMPRLTPVLRRGRCHHRRGGVVSPGSRHPDARVLRSLRHGRRGSARACVLDVTCRLPDRRPSAMGLRGGHRCL